MVGTLLHAHHFQPRRCLRKERRTGDHTGALPLSIAAGELRSHCEKELVDTAMRHKVAEKYRTSFVEKELHREFIAEQLQDGGGRNVAFTCFLALTSVEASAATPLLSSSSRPVAEVRIRALTPGVRNTAFWRSTAPLPLTITFSGGSGLLSCCRRYRA